MSNLGKRLMSSAVIVTGCILVIFKLPGWLFILTVEAFCLVAFHEYLAICQRKNIFLPKGLTLSFAALIPLFSFWGLDSFLLIFACLFGFIFYFRKEDHPKALLHTALMLFGLVYIVWFFAHVIKMRFLIHGASWVFYTALLVKGGDAGAYFIGSKFGRRKLAEHISPQKSIEGAWGGLAVTLILSLASASYLPDVSFFHLVFLGLMIGIVSQVGDLVESVMKRDAGLKDSGSIPGLGGVFDVLDSLLPTIPLVYYYLVHFFHATPMH